MIKCRVCNKDKNKKDFYSGNICKKCHRARQNHYRKNTPPKEMQFNNGKPWTTEDTEYLKQFMHTDSLEELGYALGRSVGAISERKTILLRKEKGQPDTWKITQYYTMPGYKKCTQCNQEYPANRNYFYLNNTSKDGLTYKCKKCTQIINNKIKTRRKKVI